MIVPVPVFELDCPSSVDPNGSTSTSSFTFFNGEPDWPSEAALFSDFFESAPVVELGSTSVGIGDDAKLLDDGKKGEDIVEVGFKPSGSGLGCIVPGDAVSGFDGSNIGEVVGSGDSFD